MIDTPDQSIIKTDFSPEVSIPDIIERRLISTGDTYRWLHATNKYNAEEIISSGLRMHKLMGLNGVAVPLSTTDRTKNHLEFYEPHRGLEHIVIISLPRFPELSRSVLLELRNNGEIPDISYASLFTDNLTIDGATDYQQTDAILPSDFIEGYFDKTSGTWIENPNYWETKLLRNRFEQNWSDDEYQQCKQELLDKFRSKALAQLDFFKSEHNKDQQDIERYPNLSTDYSDE